MLGQVYEAVLHAWELVAGLPYHKRGTKIWSEREKHLHSIARSYFRLLGDGIRCLYNRIIRDLLLVNIYWVQNRRRYILTPDMLTRNHAVPHLSLLHLMAHSPQGTRLRETGVILSEKDFHFRWGALLNLERNAFRDAQRTANSMTLTLEVVIRYVASLRRPDTEAEYLKLPGRYPDDCYTFPMIVYDYTAAELNNMGVPMDHINPEDPLGDQMVCKLCLGDAKDNPLDHRIHCCDYIAKSCFQILELTHTEEEDRVYCVRIPVEDSHPDGQLRKPHWYNSPNRFWEDRASPTGRIIDLSNTNRPEFPLASQTWAREADEADHRARHQ